MYLNPPLPGEECDEYTPRYYTEMPCTQAQADAAVALAEWLFVYSYKWGKPVDNANVFGASTWGHGIFGIQPPEPAPAPIPWRHPIANGCISQGYYGQAIAYHCTWHAAIDIVDDRSEITASHPTAAVGGRAVYPAAGSHSGITCDVVDSGYDAAVMGHWVRLRHSTFADNDDQGLPIIDTVYMHLRHKPAVVAGDKIDWNTIIGYVGGTPCWDDHLHLAVYVWENTVGSTAREKYEADAYNTNVKGRGGIASASAGCEYRKDPEDYIPFMPHHYSPTTGMWVGCEDEEP